MRGHTFRPLGSGAAVAAGVEITHDASCFADEVVVDFPSVAAAVDRMRHAFLADERGASLSMSIRLSPHEARSGATVPLEVPVRCTCPHCGGRGGTWTERCQQCAGSGTRMLRHQLQVSVPAGVLDGTRFYFTVTPRQDPPTRIELHVLVA
jgi:DnaJ-class molecular chaperone